MAPGGNGGERALEGIWPRVFGQLGLNSVQPDDITPVWRQSSKREYVCEAYTGSRQSAVRLNPDRIARHSTAMASKAVVL